MFNIGSTSPTFGGDYLESFLQDTLCQLLPNVLKDRLWLTPEMNKYGEVLNPGFSCNPTPSVKKKGSKLTPTNPEFIFEEGSPAPAKQKNPQSYLIGDVKFTISQAHDSMKKPSNQWLAMSNHASKYQLVPFATYITFRWTTNAKFSQNLPAYQAATLSDMQERAIAAGVILVIANIYD